MRQWALGFSPASKSSKQDARLRVVVVRGAGKAFSAGGDLEMLEKKTELSKEENHRRMLTFYNQFLSIRELNVPVIAALNGHAVGAGLCFSLACDVRIAKDGAKLGLNFVRLALHPGMGVTYYLPRILGIDLASELLLAEELFLQTRPKTSVLLITSFQKMTLKRSCPSLLMKCSAVARKRYEN